VHRQDRVMVARARVLGSGRSSSFALSEDGLMLLDLAGTPVRTLHEWTCFGATRAF